MAVELGNSIKDPAFSAEATYQKHKSLDGEVRSRRKFGYWANQQGALGSLVAHKNVTQNPEKSWNIRAQTKPSVTKEMVRAYQVNIQ